MLKPLSLRFHSIVDIIIYKIVYQSAVQFLCVEAILETAYLTSKRIFDISGTHTPILIPQYVACRQLCLEQNGSLLYLVLSLITDMYPVYCDSDMKVKNMARP